MDKVQKHYSFMFASYVKGRTQTEGVWEQGLEENICSSEG
jgi:hypothetical protein